MALGRQCRDLVQLIINGFLKFAQGRSNILSCLSEPDQCLLPLGTMGATTACFFVFFAQEGRVKWEHDLLFDRFLAKSDMLPLLLQTRQKIRGCGQGLAASALQYHVLDTVFQTTISRLFPSNNFREPRWWLHSYFHMEYSQL